jgi:hypothetical protein
VFFSLQELRLDSAMAEQCTARLAEELLFSTEASGSEEHFFTALRVSRSAAKLNSNSFFTIFH